MYVIENKNDMTPAELKPGIVTIKNTSKKIAALSIYVANKDAVSANLAAGSTVKITVSSAGEAYFYLSQKSDTLEVELADAE